MSRREADRAREIFESQLEEIDRIVHRIRRRHRLSIEDGEDFASWVQLKLMENDYRVLRRFRGKSSLGTYLTTVIQRLFLDYRIARWGRWRPSARARSGGAVAMRLEALLERDRLPLTEAVEVLVRNYRVTESRQALYALAASLPQRPSRRFARLEDLAEPVAAERADRAVVDAERGLSSLQAERTLGAALAALPREDLELLQMRFAEGSTVAQIARRLKVPQRPLYTRVERSLRRLRRSCERRGLTREVVADLLSTPGLEIHAGLGAGRKAA